MATDCRGLHEGRPDVGVAEEQLGRRPEDQLTARGRRPMVDGLDQAQITVVDDCIGEGLDRLPEAAGARHDDRSPGGAIGVGGGGAVSGQRRPVVAGCGRLADGLHLHRHASKGITTSARPGRLGSSGPVGRAAEPSLDRPVGGGRLHPPTAAPGRRTVVPGDCGQLDGQLPGEQADPGRDRPPPGLPDDRGVTADLLAHELDAAKLAVDAELDLDPLALIMAV